MSTTNGALQTPYPWSKRNRQTDFYQTDSTARTKKPTTWLTIDGSKPTNDWWQTLHESFSQCHHVYTDQSRLTDQLYNIIDWQILFTWLWRWLPLRLSKRQSPTTVLFRTTLTQMITQYELPNYSLFFYPLPSLKIGGESKVNILVLFFIFPIKATETQQTRAKISFQQSPLISRL